MSQAVEQALFGPGQELPPLGPGEGQGRLGDCGTPYHDHLALDSYLHACAAVAFPVPYRLVRCWFLPHCAPIDAGSAPDSEINTTFRPMSMPW